MENILKKHSKIINIALVVLIGIVPLLAAFNSNLWFDEAYSVGLANQPWGNLFVSAINDVHPVLYYVLLKLYSLICGTSVIALRIFSIIPIVILAIFTATKLKKQFGEKISFYFLIVLLLLPVTMHYGSQIRMYSWAMLFVTLTAFYAYKAFKYNEKKHWIIFVIFSILSAYTHHFALFTIGVINLVLLFYVIRKKKELLKRWFIYGVLQIVLFIPGLIIFIMQSTRVASGFWISVNFPDIFGQIIQFFFQDSITSDNSILKAIPSIFALFIVIYMILRVHKLYIEDKEKIRPATITLSVCGIVVLVTLLVSLVRAVFIPRYMLPMLGLLIFAFAYVLSVEKTRVIKTIILVGLLILTVWNGVCLMQKSYSEENNKPMELIESELQEGDIFVYSNVGPSSSVAIKFKDNKQYFYNAGHWTVEKAYGAFAPQMTTIEDLTEIENHTGRIWVIDDGSSNMYDIMKEMEGTKVLKEVQEFYHPFSGDTFKISLFEKN